MYHSTCSTFNIFLVPKKFHFAESNSKHCQQDHLIRNKQQSESQMDIVFRDNNNNTNKSHEANNIKESTIPHQNLLSVNMCHKNHPHKIYNHFEISDSHSTFKNNTSRLTRKMAALVQSGRVSRVKYCNDKIDYICYFCKCKSSKTFKKWFLHITQHTGETCTYNKYKKDVSAYICKLCNYVQLEKARVIQHLRVQHKTPNNNYNKIVLLPRKRKPTIHVHVHHHKHPLLHSNAGHYCWTLYYFNKLIWILIFSRQFSFYFQCAEVKTNSSMVNQPENKMEMPDVNLKQNSSSERAIVLETIQMTDTAQGSRNIFKSNSMKLI